MSVSSRKTYDTDLITLRRIFAYDLSNSPFSTGFILTSLTKGVATFLSPTVALSTVGLGDIPGQFSTVEGQIISTGVAFFPSLPSTPEIFLPSTVTGLATSGYISTSILQSTIEGLGTYGYISSLIIGEAIQSTVVGLGSAGYISTATLNSTIEGLGTLGYLSSTSLTSSIDAALPSTVQGLGTAGYISSLSFFSTFNTAFPSTVEGLGTAGYISTQSLQSTVLSLTSLGFVSSLFSTFRSSFSNSYTGNWCNAGFLYSNLAPLSTVQSFQFDMGDSLRNQMNINTTNIDIEFKANLQFGYFDARSIQYDFSTCLVRGVSLNTSTIIGQENISYYILNASAVNLPFFFTEKYRFLVNDSNTISTLKSQEEFSTLSLFHRVGISSPTTNQLFVFPARPTSITMVLDNSTRTL
jgi:hypothetical protein